MSTINLSFVANRAHEIIRDEAMEAHSIKPVGPVLPNMSMPDMMNNLGMIGVKPLVSENMAEVAAAPQTTVKPAATVAAQSPSIGTETDVAATVKLASATATKAK